MTWIHWHENIRISKEIPCNANRNVMRSQKCHSCNLATQFLSFQNNEPNSLKDCVASACCRRVKKEANTLSLNSQSMHWWQKASFAALQNRMGLIAPALFVRIEMVSCAYIWWRNCPPWCKCVYSANTGTNSFEWSRGSAADPGSSSAPTSAQRERTLRHVREMSS